MSLRKKLLKGGHLSEQKCREVLRLFCEDLTATEIAAASNVSRVTINNYCRLIRSLIAAYCQQYAVNTHLGNNFAGNRFQGGSLYGLYHKNNRVIAEWLDESFAWPDTVASAHFPGHYDAIADVRRWSLHWLTPPDRADSPAEDIATFWTFTQARLQKFRGLNKNTLYLHIRESEFRYNHRDHDIFALLIENIHNSAKDTASVSGKGAPGKMNFA